MVPSTPRRLSAVEDSDSLVEDSDSLLWYRWPIYFDDLPVKMTNLWSIYL